MSLSNIAANREEIEMGAIDDDDDAFKIRGRKSKSQQPENEKVVVVAANDDDDDDDDVDPLKHRISYVVEAPRNLQRFVKRGVFQMMHEPAKIDAPRDTLRYRGVFVVCVTTVIATLTAVFLALESTSLTQETNDISAECPLHINPVVIRDIQEDSEYLFSIAHTFELYSESECERFLTLNFSHPSASSVRRVFYCMQPQMDKGDLECWVNDRVTWNLNASQIDSIGFNGVILYGIHALRLRIRIPQSFCSVAPYCENNIRFINETATTMCVGGLHEDRSAHECFPTTETPSDASTSGICRLIVEMNLPHLCTITLTNSALTILSLTFSNAATAFTLALNAAFILWKYSLSEALTERGNSQADNRAVTENSDDDDDPHKLFVRQGGLVDVMSRRRIAIPSDNTLGGSTLNTEETGIRRRRVPISASPSIVSTAATVDQR